MITFRLANHTIRPGVKIVEILLDEAVVGIISPGDVGKDFRIVSAHIVRIEDQHEKAYVRVTLDRREFQILADGVWRRCVWGSGSPGVEHHCTALARPGEDYCDQHQNSE